MKFTVPKPPKEARQIITILRRHTRPVRNWSGSGGCARDRKNGWEADQCPMGLHPLATDPTPVTPSQFGAPTVKQQVVAEFYEWWDNIPYNLLDSNRTKLDFVPTKERKQAYRRASYMIWPTKKGR